MEYLFTLKTRLLIANLQSVFVAKLVSISKNIGDKKVDMVLVNVLAFWGTFGVIWLLSVCLRSA